MKSWHFVHLRAQFPDKFDLGVLYGLALPLANTSGHFKVVSHLTSFHDAAFNIVIKNGYSSPDNWPEVEEFDTLGTYLSHDATGNDNNNFYIKIRKMEAKLNNWLSRYLIITPFGRTLLAKSLGLSLPVNLHCIYTFCSRNSFFADAEKLFAFIWRNKTEEIKRRVLFRPLSKVD